MCFREWQSIGLPGEVAVSNWDHRNIVATVQCAPPKSVSYTEFDFDERYTVEGMSGNKTEDDIYIWYYEDEITPFELDVVDNSYNFWEFSWSIRTSYTDYNKVSVFTYLPWTCGFIIGIAAFAVHPLDAEARRGGSAWILRNAYGNTRGRISTRYITAR